MHIELVIFIFVCVVWIIILVLIAYCCLIWCRSKQPYNEISTNALTSSTCEVHGNKTTNIPIHASKTSSAGSYGMATEIECSCSQERAKEMINAPTYQEIPFASTILTNFHV
ncbi:hypothetical protein ILUMI_11056 [Ignelater luminosus]|uniref:Uncharacterized protein n=1 Tax=Ignelater luminosus TaxID=2038154 RepID=A0A8K0GDL0_IGNLU|nr:hypothetical protein ILUMI_11056 [Ignelater luminosus]